VDEITVAARARDDDGDACDGRGADRGGDLERRPCCRGGVERVVADLDRRDVGGDGLGDLFGPARQDDEPTSTAPASTVMASRSKTRSMASDAKPVG